MWPWWLKMSTSSYIVILILAVDAQVWKMLEEIWDVERFLSQNQLIFFWPSHPFNSIHTVGRAKPWLTMVNWDQLFSSCFQPFSLSASSMVLLKTDDDLSLTDWPTLLVHCLQHYLEPFFSSSLAKTQRHKDTKTQRQKDTKTQRHKYTTRQPQALPLKLPRKWWL